MKDYELIEHTADIGVRIKAKTLKDLFVKAGVCLFDIIAERKSNLKIRLPKTKCVIKQKAGDLEELFVNWLNDLLSLSATKELIFVNFKIKRLDNKNLEAEVLGEDIKNYKINTEIKAATYHQLKLEKKDTGWQAEVIFDV